MVQEEKNLLTTSYRKTKREIEEDHTPLWIKIFGGSILSVVFLCVITLIGYIVSNINNLQTQINTINVEGITKKDFNDRQTTMWNTFSESLKNSTDSLQITKDKLIIFEQMTKERQIWMEKFEKSMKDQTLVVENSNKEIAGQKERSSLLETQLNQYREENKQLQKDLQFVREKVAALEGKNK